MQIAFSAGLGCTANVTNMFFRTRTRTRTRTRCMHFEYEYHFIEYEYEYDFMPNCVI